MSLSEIRLEQIESTQQISIMQVNTWNVYFNYRDRDEDMIDHRSCKYNLSSCEIKAWKKAWKNNSGLNGIRTHDFCDIGAVLYQLSCEANWELPTHRYRRGHGFEYVQAWFFAYFLPWIDFICIENRMIYLVLILFNLCWILFCR